MNPMPLRAGRRRALLPLAALTLALGACGGENNDFIEGYNAAVAPMQELMTDLGSGTGGDAKAGEQLDAVADGFDEMRADLDALEPPEDATDELDRMLAALDKGADQVREMGAAVEAQDNEQLQQISTEFSATGTELVTVEEELRKAVEG